MELDTIPKINKEAYTPPPHGLSTKEIQIGKLPVTAAAGGRNLYSSDVVKDGQKRGTVGGLSNLYFSGRYLEMDIFERGKE